MPSSYTTSLRLTLPATGELTGTWGTTVNTGITELLDAAVAGTTTISSWGGAGVPYTLSNTDGAADEARRMFIVASGTPGEAKNVICPAVSKLYFFRNDTIGGFALTLKTSGGSGITVPAGQARVLYCNGTNVVEAFNAISSLTLGTALGAGSGGTGQSTYVIGDLLYATGTTALSKLGIGTNGQILTSTGTAPQWSTLSGVAVTTFSGGTTGLTPTPATSGAITLAGTLATTNGGTGLTSFTANRVLYASSTSAIGQSANLTFDGTNLGLGDGSQIRSPDNFAIFDTSSSLARISWSTNNTYASRTGGAHIFNAAAAEQMRLTSTGLGIGNSAPNTKLDITTTANNGIRLFQTGAANAWNIYTSGNNLRFIEENVGSVMSINAGGNVGIGTTSPGNYRLNVSGSSFARAGFTSYTSDGLFGATALPSVVETPSNTGQIRFGYVDNGLGSYTPRIGFFQATNVGASTIAAQNSIGNDASGNLTFGVGSSNTIRMTIDPSGNLGLGVTPSAWQSTKRAIQFGSGALIATPTTAMELGQNFFINSGGASIYSNNGFATDYAQVNGTHQWFTAPSGTAGNAISFTQAMTLDASGNLGVGTNSPGTKLDVKQSGTNWYDGIRVVRSTNDNQRLVFGNTSGASWIASVDAAGGVNNELIFGRSTNGTTFTESGRFDSSGNLGVGTTSPLSILTTAGSTNPTITIRNTTSAVTTGQTVGSLNWYTDDTSTLPDRIVASISAVASGDYTGTNNAPTDITFSTHSAGAAAVERMRLDSIGNLGLGVTPSAWGTGKAIEVGAQGVGIWGISSTDFYSVSNTRFDGANYRYVTTAAATAYQQFTGTHRWYNAASGTAGAAIAFTQAMTLDASGNLGIGTTSPAFKLDVQTLSSRFQVRDGASTGGTNAGTGLTSVNTANNALTDFNYRAAQHSFIAGASTTTAMLLDSSGNLGLGVTPSPWFTSWRVLDVARSGGLYADASGTNAVGITNNAYLNSGASAWVYKVTNFATHYQQSLGTHAWYTAPSGTAGNAVTFTEAARITTANTQVLYQPAESAQNTSVTLTVANLQARIITSNAAVTLTLPTGTTLEGYTTNMATDTAFECTFIATTANAITIAANGNTTVGSLTVSGNTSGTFRFRKTATNTFTVYRVA